MKKIIISLLFSLLFQSASGSEYFVPVSEELEPFAHFEMDQITFGETKQKQFLEFVMPPDLVGIENFKVKFQETERTDERVSLQGVFGSALCDQPVLAKDVECVIDYNGTYMSVLDILDPVIEEAMIERALDEIDLERRKAIWESFSGDPLGILTI